MAFPNTPNLITTEMRIGGVWTDISDDVLNREVLKIVRGRADEGNRAEAGKVTLQLNNRDGRYSPRNPLGPHYGLLSRNLEMRTSIHAGEPYLSLNGDPATIASTPDHASLDLVADLDLRVEATANWHDPTAFQVLAAKWDADGDERSYLVRVSEHRLIFLWNTDGTSGGTEGWQVDLPTLPDRAAVRVTLDADNGAGGHDVAFYWAGSMDGPWFQLGETVTFAGTTSIHAGTAALSAGGYDDTTGGTVRVPVTGRVHVLQLRDGIDGTLVADPDFTAQDVGTTSFVDGAGRTWTMQGDAEITDRRVRVSAEISALPPRWDLSGNDAYVQVQASGIRRRLSQGRKGSASALRREITAPHQPAAVAYWPCEDGQDATTLGSGIGGPAMRITGDLDLASYQGIAGSDSLPVLAAGTSADGQVPAYPATGETQVRWVMAVPEAPSTDGQVLLRVLTSGTAARWDVVYRATGNLEIYAYSRAGSLLISDIGVFDVNTGAWQVSLELTQNGADIDYVLQVLEAGGDGPSFGITDTVTTATAGTITQVVIAPGMASPGIALGHLSVRNTIVVLFDLKEAITGWAGETANARILRLCAEQGVPVQTGSPADSEPVGVQRPAPFLDLLDEAAAADGGILLERRESLGLLYRARDYRYNRPVTLALDYTAPGEIPPSPTPADDDKDIRNDVTVTRTGGSSSRVVDETSPLSVLPPGEGGVGPYDTSVTLNLATDDATGQHAAWRVHLGTWDDLRLPQLRVNLASAPHLIDDAVDFDVADRATIANPPVWMGPDTADLQTLGYTEHLSLTGWDLYLNCVPGGPWDVGVLDQEDVPRHADTDGSVLASATTATATTLEITTHTGPPWSPHPADYPIDLRVGGEVVTAICPGQVLNTNPGFETGTSGWSATNAVLGRSTLAWRGSYSGLLTTGPGTDPRAENALAAVVPGAPYRASGRLYAPADPGVNCGVDVNWFNAAFGYVSTSFNAAPLTPGEWQPYEATFTAPPTAAWGQLRFSLSGTPGAGVELLGDELYLVPAPGPALLDTFTRASAPGWGIADSGQDWTHDGGAAADYTVDGSAGIISVSAVAASRIMVCGQQTDGSHDLEMRARTLVTALTQPINTYLLACYTDPNSHYLARMAFHPDSSIGLSLERAPFALLAAEVTVPGLTHTANTWYRLRFQVFEGVLRAKAWADGDAEPAAWTVTAADTTYTIGQIGVRAVLTTGNTNTLPVITQFDDITSRQHLTVERATNNIVKAHPAGADIRLAHPMTIAL